MLIKRMQWPTYFVGFVLIAVWISSFLGKRFQKERYRQYSDELAVVKQEVENLSVAIRDIDRELELLSAWGWETEKAAREDLLMSRSDEFVIYQG